MNLDKEQVQAIAFTPDTLFKISECHDPRFYEKREEISVLLNSQHPHSRDSFRRTFFAKSAIFSKSIFFDKCQGFQCCVFPPDNCLTKSPDPDVSPRGLRGVWEGIPDGG